MCIQFFSILWLLYVISAIFEHTISNKCLEISIFVLYNQDIGDMSLFVQLIMVIKMGDYLSHNTTSYPGVKQRKIKKMKTIGGN